MEKREKERKTDISNLNDQMLLMHATRNPKNVCVETHFRHIQRQSSVNNMHQNVLLVYDLNMILS